MFDTQGMAEWQGILDTVTHLTKLRDLKLELGNEDEEDPELEAAIAASWPRQLTNLAALDLRWSKLGPSATAALLYDMPSLTSLQCWTLSAPNQQQLGTQLRDIAVMHTDLPTLASLRLGPQCNLSLDLCLKVAEGGLEEGGQQLAAAADTLRHCEWVSLDGHGIQGPLQAEASQRVVRTLAAGLGGAGSHRVDALEFRYFTLQQGSSAAFVELLRTAPLVDRLDFL